MCIHSLVHLILKFLGIQPGPFGLCLLFFFFLDINSFYADDVVSQRLKFGSTFLSSSWESKIALFF